MRDKTLAEFSLEDGSKVLVEVEEPESSGVERVGFSSGRLVVKAGLTFEDALARVMPMTNNIIKQLRRLETPADELEIKFGLKLNAEVGVILTSVGGGEANYEITLKFKQP